MPDPMPEPAGAGGIGLPAPDLVLPAALGWDGDGLKDFFDEFCMTDPVGLYFW